MKVFDPKIDRLIKFCLTGFIGLLVDFSTTWFLKELIQTNAYLANSCGFTLAVVCNYYINRRWTFKSVNQSIKKEFLSFLVVSVIGLLLNNSFVYVFAEYFQYPFYRSKAAAIILVFIWNFTANSYFTFGLRKNHSIASS